jgi:hypothetical protein
LSPEESDWRKRVIDMPPEDAESRRRFLRFGWTLLAVGCGYSLRPMYPAQVRTVHVPMAKSNDFRRGLEFRLTESIVKEIEEKTPYKVVDRDRADTVLEARILGLGKRVRNETPTDEPRELQLNLVVEVTWHDLRNGLLLRGPEEIALPPTLQRVARTADMVPEIGETFATASQEAIDDLAEQIVAMMEEPW